MHKPTRLRAMLALLLCISLKASALGPQNTAVVVNADSFASRAIANEFVALRDIPDANVIELHLAALENFEQIGVDDFRKLILQPVLDAIKTRGLSDQIDCVAYSSDIPYAIQVSADVGDKKLPQVITPVASLNGLTYLYRLVLAKDISYLDLATNHYAGRILTADRERFNDADRQQVRIAFSLVKEKKWPEAASILKDLVKAHPKAQELQYDLACCLAQDNKPDDAIAALTAAVEAGFWDAGHMRDDNDLKSLHDRKDFKDLLGKIKPPPIQAQPPKVFHSNKEGYLLSIMLGVTSGRGNSLNEVLDCLRRSKAADGSWPKGTIFYMINGDVRSTTRQWGFQAAADALQKLGVNAEAVKGVLPEHRPDVAGAMVGISDFDWPKSGSTILPGAICEHLTSLGGVIVNNGGQTPISEFIRRGASGSSGTVTEPYALQQKFPTPFIHWYYAQGCTLIESFYQSLTGPYQLLIIGDPLCRPWGLIPIVSAGDVPNPIKAMIKFTPTAKAITPAPQDFELYIDGHLNKSAHAGDPIELDTTKLTDGHHELRFIALGKDAGATEGYTILPLQVSNAGHRLTVSTPPASLPNNTPLNLTASCPAAERIVFLHNNEELASIAGEKGEAQIDITKLGFGPVRIQPVAILNDKDQTRIAAEPLRIQIQPPTSLPAIQLTAKLTAGLLLKPATRPATPTTAKSLNEALDKTSLKENEAFSLEGYFEVPINDLYQFQLRFNGQATIKIDDQPQPETTPDHWNYLPISLAAGTHQIEAHFNPKGKSKPDLRFGGNGAQPIRPDTFHYQVAATQPQ